MQASEVGGVEAGCATDMIPDARRASGAASAGHERLPWWAGWRCLAVALGRLGSGAPPHGAHAPFLQRNIDAATLLGRATPAGPSLAPKSVVVPITSLDLGRGVESILRALNNLSEEFHHARPSYILLTPSQVRCPAQPHTSTPSNTRRRTIDGNDDGDGG